MSCAMGFRDLHGSNGAKCFEDWHSPTWYKVLICPILGPKLCQKSINTPKNILFLQCPKIIIIRAQGDPPKPGVTNTSGDPPLLQFHIDSLNLLRRLGRSLTGEIEIWRLGSLWCEESCASFEASVILLRMISNCIAVHAVVSDYQWALYNEIHLLNYFRFRNFEPPQTRGTGISETTGRVS